MLPEFWKIVGWAKTGTCVANSRISDKTAFFVSTGVATQSTHRPSWVDVAEIILCQLNSVMNVDVVFSDVQIWLLRLPHPFSMAHVIAEA